MPESNAGVLFLHAAPYIVAQCQSRHSATQYTLSILGRDGALERVPLSGQKLSLGRGESSGLCFASDPHLSGNHLEFLKRGDGWAVRDPGARNGSWVNDVRLVDERTMEPGDILTAGGLGIRAEVEMTGPVEAETTLGQALTGRLSRSASDSGATVPLEEGRNHCER